MSFTFLSVTILFIFATALITQIYRNVSCGLRRALISLGALVLSLLLSIATCSTVAGLIASPVLNIVRKMSFYESIEESFPSIYSLAHTICTAAVGIIIFIPLLFLIRAILKAIAIRIFKDHSEEKSSTPEYSRERDSYFDRNEKTLCAIIGVICALIVTMSVSAPIMGAVDLSKTALSIATVAIEEEPDDMDYSAESEESELFYSDELAINLEAVDRYSKDAFAGVFYHIGGKAIFRGITTVNIYQGRNDILTELETLGKIVTDFRSIEDNLTKPALMTAEQIRTLDDLGDKINELKICDGVLADFTQRLSGAWLRGNIYSGISKPKLGSYVEPVFDEILNVCRYSDAYNVKENIGTVIDVYVAVLKSGVLSVNQNNMKAIMICLESSELVEKIENILADNMYMNAINITSVSMRVLADNIQQDSNKYSSTNYDNLMNNLASAINTVKARGYSTEEEMVSVLADYADRYVADYGIDIPKSVADAVAKELIIFTSYTNYLSPEDMQYLIESYAGGK